MKIVMKPPLVRVLSVVTNWYPVSRNKIVWNAIGQALYENRFMSTLPKPVDFIL